MGCDVRVVAFAMAIDDMTGRRIVGSAGGVA
jgi:hypothetical protein